MQGTLDTLEDDIKVNTAAIATLDEDFKDKMKHSVAYIVKNDDDNTTKIIKALPWSLIYQAGSCESKNYHSKN